MSERIFQGRTAVVTGGSRGIGRAISLMLAGHGARVAVNYERNEQAAQDALRLMREVGGEGMAVRADIARPADVERMLAQVRAQLGPIDFLVNNAGIADTVPHSELTFAHWKRTFEVNV